MQELAEVPEFFIKLEQTFTEQHSINFVFEFMPGQDLLWVI
jgi:hypothetical protein